MQINTRNLIRSMEDLGVSQRSLATKSGVKRQIINAAVKERRGLSLEASRRIAPQLGIEPVSLYLETQLSAIKSRLDAPDMKVHESVPASVLRSIAQIVKALDNVPRSEVANDADAQAALAELSRIANALIQSGATAAKDPEQGEQRPALKRCDAHGRVVPESGEDTRRDMFGRRLTGA